MIHYPGTGTYLATGTYFFQWPQTCPSRIWIRPDTTDPEHPLYPVLWIRIGFIAEPDPALRLKADLDPDPNQTLSHKS